MDENPELKRLAQLKALMIATYDMIAVLLGALPVPIGMPRFPDPAGWQEAQAAPAVQEAVRALAFEPAADSLKAEVRSALHEWLGCYYWTVFTEIGGPSPFQAEIMSEALLRCAAAIDRAREVIESGEAG